VDSAIAGSSNVDSAIAGSSNVSLTHSLTNIFYLPS
jgi:hypothetical protein